MIESRKSPGLRPSVALSIGALLLGGCAAQADEGRDESKALGCFPAPTTGAVRASAAVSPPPPAPETGDRDQGTTLQGPPRAPGEHDQGTTLQGPAPTGPRPDEEEQGAFLQGPTTGGPLPGEKEQGVNLQGPTPIGGLPGEREQGVNLQGPMTGGPLPGEKDQGVNLQGPTTGGPIPGERDQGATLQGDDDGGPRPGMEAQGRTFGFADLNGARLEIAADGTPVSAVGGALVAKGFESTAALRGSPLAATARDGGRFTVEVVSAERVDGVELVDILIDGRSACAPGDHGLFVEGSWDDRGAHAADPGTLTYSCRSGVIAKCVEWGYAPWRVGAPRHAACTRLARADYCGDGTAWTLEGTTIGLHDALGVRAFESGRGFSFEAGWGPGGAICVNETRYRVEDRDGNAVLPSCLASLPRCASLAEAQGLGAELANESTHDRIDACE
jgi:hypothetical protein